MPVGRALRGLDREQPKITSRPGWSWACDFRLLSIQTAAVWPPSTGIASVLGDLRTLATSAIHRL
jgi:hypothetical protein